MFYYLVPRTSYQMIIISNFPVDGIQHSDSVVFKSLHVIKWYTYTLNIKF